MVVEGEYFGGLSAGSAVDILQKIAAGKRPPEGASKAADHKKKGRGI